MKLYHITRHKYLDEIMQVGLIPMIGDRSRGAEDIEPVICLCEEKDVYTWKILTGGDTLLSVDVKDNIDKFEFSTYGEYRWYMLVPPSHIEVLNSSILNDSLKLNEANERLCKNYLITISNICLQWARADLCRDKDYANECKRELAGMIERLINCVNLDYTSVGDNVIKKHLMEYGEDGEYSLCDTWMNTSTLLWQKMAEYDDKYQRERMLLYDYINENIPVCNTFNTGGFTG